MTPRRDAGKKALIVLPAAQELPGGDFGGKLENTRDSLHMITRSKDHVILISLGFTAVVMLFYNVLGMQVRKTGFATLSPLTPCSPYDVTYTEKCQKNHRNDGRRK